MKRLICWFLLGHDTGDGPFMAPLGGMRLVVMCRRCKAPLWGYQAPDNFAMQTPTVGEVDRFWPIGRFEELN